MAGLRNNPQFATIRSMTQADPASIRSRGLCNVEHEIPGGDQCCCFSRNIAQVTPKNIYFYYQKIYIYRIKVSKKINNLILKKKNTGGDVQVGRWLG